LEEKQIDLSDTVAIERIGPFSDFYQITIDGYLVPYIELRKYPDGRGWDLTLNHCHGVDMTDEEVNKFIWWIANAMAVAAGYTSFGEHSKPANPFSTRCFGISIDTINELNSNKKEN
jgi:hypothetical protein